MELSSGGDKKKDASFPLIVLRIFTKEGSAEFRSQYKPVGSSVLTVSMLTN